MHRDGASEAVEAAQSQARPSHGRSEQIASNCSKHVVGVGSNGETKGRKASGTDRTFSDFRRAERYQEHIWGAVLGAPHLARGVGATHRAKHGAICVGAEQRYTNGCPCCGTRCVMSKTVSCSSRSRTLCAGVQQGSPCGQTSMHCCRALSVVVCKCW